jgi:predicted enzyme related to lactoylglutathione lyase
MRIQGLYAAIAATDMKASEAFYTTLFGRGPDDRPMNTLIQWRDVAGANVQVFLNDKNAGSSMMTIVVPDMDAARTDLHAHGFSLGPAQTGDFGRIAHIEDPAGNQLTLAEPPQGMRAG